MNQRKYSENSIVYTVDATTLLRLVQDELNLKQCYKISREEIVEGILLDDKETFEICSEFNLNMPLIYKGFEDYVEYYIDHELTTGGKLVDAHVDYNGSLLYVVFERVPRLEYHKN